MESIFPEPIRNLPRANIELPGVNAYLLQGENQQIIFMEFEKDLDLEEHAHDSQWEIVLEGKVDLWIAGKKQRYTKGDRFFIPKGVKHSASIYAGYTAIAFFNQKNRYYRKKTPDSI